MEEARRYVRYVIPGMALIIQLAIIHIFNVGICRALMLLGKLEIVITSILVAAVLGFIVSSIYYVLHWCIYLTVFKTINYESIAEEFTKEVKGLKPFTDFTQEEAWVRLNVFWNFEANNDYTNMLRSTDRMSDVLHSIGTTIIALFIGVFLSIFLIDNHCRKLLFLLINLVPILFLCINYYLNAIKFNNLYTEAYRFLASKVNKKRRRKKFE